VTVQAQVVDGVVHDIAFEARGCALSRAAASIMTTMVIDHDLAAARALATRFEQFVQSPADAAVPEDLGALGAFAGVRRFRARRVCALLAFRALQAALDRAL
jgi:nitrogen fixation NifU-like protein